MPEKTTLRIGTFNVNNLALPDVDFFPPRPPALQGERHSQREYRDKCA